MVVNENGLKAGTCPDKDEQIKPKIKASMTLNCIGIALSLNIGATMKKPVKRIKGHHTWPRNCVISLKDNAIYCVTVGIELKTKLKKVVNSMMTQ